jgi:PBP4 family serine-type D-alanyl-D-alanine carboxypeptidase
VYWRRIFQPALYTGWAFIEELKAQGIDISPPEIQFRKISRQMPLLIRHQSSELGALIRKGNKHSSNHVAEQLFLAMGAERFGYPATYSKGRAAVAEYLGRLGVQPGRYFLENGSGLSKRSFLRPMDMVRVIESLHHDFFLNPPLQSSLPLAGSDGTLKRRFRGARAEGMVRAKTGTLGSALCLSGLAGYGSDRLVFSFLANRVRRLPLARGTQRALVGCLVDYLRHSHESM